MEHLSPTPSPIGGRSFIDPARVRILLAPVGDVSEADFAQWCDYVRTFETIRLTDLSSSCGVRKAAAASSPHVLQSGEVHLSFVTSYDPDHAFLAPFNLHRQVLGVLGLTSFSPAADRDELERTPAALRELHPGAIVHRVFAFDTGASRKPETIDLSSIKTQDPTATTNVGSPSSAAGPHARTPSSESGFSSRKDAGLVIFPAVRKDGKDIRFYLKTLLAELVAGILDGLDQIVAGLEGMPLETPRETLEGIANGRASSMFSPLGSPPPRPFARPNTNAVGGGSQPPGGVAPSSSSSESTRSKIIAANANKKPKRVTSMLGTGPSGTGRFAKVQADFHLLCGSLWEALERYAASLGALGKERALAGGQDAVWFASALEGFAVTRVLVSRMGGLVLEKAPCFDLPWSGKDKDKEKDGIPRPYAKESWAEVAEAYTIALIIYSKCLAPPSVLLEPAKSVTNETPRDFTHPLIHAGASVQYARFLLAVWASAGWNGECFDQLVYGGIPPSLAEDKPSHTVYARFTSLSAVARHDIAAAASSALTHSVAALKSSDQITLLSTLTGIFGCIGFSRREAYLLRQLQNVIVKLLESAIRFKSRPAETTSLPLQCEAAADEVLGNMVVQVTTDAVGRGPEAILVLAMQICETYGIHVEVEPLRNVPSTHILSKASDGLRSAYASPAPPSQEWTSNRTRQRSHKTTTTTPHTDTVAAAAVVTPLEMQSEAPFGWKEQQISLLKDTISIAELLGDHLGMAFFAAVLLRDFHPLLTAEEQRDLLHGIRRTVQAARWQGAHTLAVKYLGPPEPLSDLQLVPLSPQRQAISKPMTELEPVRDPATAVDQGVAGVNNPFFWNPSRASASTGSRTAVQNESIQVMATLQNPFLVELEIDALKLVTEGVAFEGVSQHVVLPPLSLQTVCLSGIASATGVLVIKGISMILSGCAEETFLLPVLDKDSEKARQTAAADADDRRTRIKVVGLDARSSVLKQRHAATKTDAAAASAKQPARAAGDQAVENEKAKYLQVDVVPAQPLLAVYCAELGPAAGGELEVYEGELQLVHLELRNMSEKVPVNFLKVRFSDDLSEAMVQAASTGELLQGDVHDLYADLLHNPVLRQYPSASQTGGGDGQTYIAAGRSLTLPILVRGKKGCTSASIIVEYGYVDDKARQLAKTFYARNVRLDFALVVRPVLVFSGLEVSPLSAVEAAKLTARNLVSTTGPMTAIGDHPVDNSGRGDGDTEAALIAATTNGEARPLDDASFCLISVDVTSVHAVDDVVVRMSLNTGGVHPLRIERTVRPGATRRLHLPLPRLSLSAEYTQREITPLGQETRQFIVSKIQLSSQEERNARRRFWYRHELLQRWKGGWTLAGAAPDSSNDDDDDGEGGERRFGDVSMRFVALDDRQTGVLARDPVKVELEFGAAGEASDSARVVAETFAPARITVWNETGRVVRAHVRLVPAVPTLPGVVVVDEQRDRARAEDPSLTHVLIADGTSTASPTPCQLSPGEAVTLTTQVLFLATGVFAFSVVVDEITPTPSPLDAARTAQLESSPGRIAFTSALTHVHVHSPDY